MQGEEACYIRKDYQLYVHSITLQQQHCMQATSTNSGSQHSLEATTTIAINKTIPVSAVDIIYKSVHSLDKDVNLLPLSFNSL